jgi:hypothetical protein
MCHKIIIVVILSIFTISEMSAQYSATFITIDPDGYTNIREQPNTKSKIVGKVYKYQMFSFLGKECDDYLENHWADSWLYVFNDKVKGYIYQKKILEINRLPSLTIKRTIKNRFETGYITCANDTLSVTMQIQAFNEQNHIGAERLLGSVNDPFDKKVMREREWEETEIKEISLITNDDKVILPYEKIKDYCNPQIMHVHIGRNGELYIYIGGGTEGEWYTVWLSVLNGKIVDTCFEYRC